MASPSQTIKCPSGFMNRWGITSCRVALHGLLAARVMLGSPQRAQQPRRQHFRCVV